MAHVDAHREVLGSSDDSDNEWRVLLTSSSDQLNPFFSAIFILNQSIATQILKLTSTLDISVYFLQKSKNLLIP